MAKFRHEQKYEINSYQYEELRQVIKELLVPDPHTGADGQYMIRSLYFDDMYRTAYNEKLDGVYSRKKYRIRIYECSDSVIHLECKRKEGAYILKESCSLSRMEYDSLLNGEFEFLLSKDSQMAKEFYLDIKTKLLKPVVIVDYEREPYIFDAGTVRITFDKNVRGCYPQHDMFDSGIPSYEIYNDDKMIVEVKFTGYLPERIRKIFKVRNFTQTSASKFCMCLDRITKM